MSDADMSKAAEAVEGVLWFCGVPKQAAQRVLRALSDAGFEVALRQPQALVDEAELRIMLRDPRYWRDRDPDFVRAVTDGFRRLTGAGPSLLRLPRHAHSDHIHGDGGVA